MSGLYETPGKKWAKKDDEIYKKHDYGRNRESLEEQARENCNISEWTVQKFEGFWVLYIR